MPSRSTADAEPHFPASAPARELAGRCEPLVDAFVQRMAAEWAVQLPDYPTLRSVDVAEAARLAVLTFLRRVQGAEAAVQNTRAVFRRRAAHRAEEGMPLPILLRTYTISARVVFEELCRTARPEETAALPELARLLLATQDEAIDQVAQAYQEELELLGSARRDRRRELVRDLVAGVAPEDPAAVEEFGLAKGAIVLALGLSRDEKGSGAESLPVEQAEVKQAAVHRRLHRLHEAVDVYFGAPIPALLEGSGGHVLVPRSTGDAATSATAPTISDELVRRLAEAWGSGIWIAMAATEQPEQIPSAARTAGEILRLVRGLGRPPGIYTLEDVLLEYHLTRPNESSGRLSTLLDPLADRPDLLHTVRVYLEEGYDRRRTAGRLGLHPNTVDNRLARVTELTGLNPATPRGVALLLTALALHDLR
ncbi:MAG TPA: helix-turn-helix domain-containing protein [Actinocrinis sp.]|uniref:PucR family transcriptional regulator n=1 Tax=Actinocrinis sp. TaxID=1920516 RepID=UPI002D483CDC|nr:helix-turn-helix domain-containing protein [Actinocrinis sp.]HZU56911.1 helix-turn-helix domain-containing protein [Actinocrinis sp.]